jgi:hypothetical protein
MKPLSQQAHPGRISPLPPSDLGVGGTEMWIDAISRARNISASTFRVAFIIARELREVDGRGQVHLYSLAREAFTSERTARDTVMELERRGFILVRRQRGTGYLKITTTLPV